MANEMTKLEKHQKFLYPACRIFSENSAGSGTIIYSKENPKSEGEYETFVLTNHHVIESSISYKKDWNSLLKRKVETENFKIPNIEVFSYVRMSEVDSSNKYKSEIIAYDRAHDLAILKIDSPRKFEFTAQLIPENKIKDIKLFTDIVVTGCSMAHEPFSNFGQITFLKEIIDEKEYLMTNSNSVFGNSGGSLFLKDTGELIGVPSRITAIQLGFGVDILTWMGFSAHPKRIYEFLKEQELHFLFDPTDTYEEAMERRKQKENDSMVAIKAELMKEE